MAFSYIYIYLNVFSLHPSGTFFETGACNASTRRMHIRAHSIVHKHTCLTGSGSSRSRWSIVIFGAAGLALFGFMALNMLILFVAHAYGAGKGVDVVEMIDWCTLLDEEGSLNNSLSTTTSSYFSFGVTTKNCLVNILFCPQLLWYS